VASSAGPLTWLTDSCAVELAPPGQGRDDGQAQRRVDGQADDGRWHASVGNPAEPRAEVQASAYASHLAVDEPQADQSLQREAVAGHDALDAVHAGEQQIAERGPVAARLLAPHRPRRCGGVVVLAQGGASIGPARSAAVSPSPFSKHLGA
jgi:hypothetical protein